MLDAQIKNLKRSGKENVSHKPAIEEEDLQKLKSSEVLSLSSPLSLLRNVWFHVVLFFCRRGLEGQRSLTTDSFKFEINTAGRNYATMSHDELSKNHPGGLKDVESTEKEARMYETEDQGDGYKALKLYLQKVNPKSTAFFQYPKKNSMALDAVWYEARPLGINSLAKNDEDHQRRSTFIQSLHKPLCKSHCHHSLVQRRDFKPPHKGHFWTPQ